MNNFEYENNHATDVDFVIVEPDFKSEAEKEVKTSPPFADEPKEKKKKANAKIAIIVALFLVSNTFAGALGGIAALKWAAPSYNSLGTGSASSVKAVTTSSKQTANSANTLSTTEIVNMNENSIVEIKTEGIATDSWLTQYITQGAGSGVIISSDGYIVTNNHVIENSNKISVTTKNGKSYTASLVGADDETDLAVLKINAKNLQPVIFGDSSTASVGDTAIAIGNPLGNLGGTVTQGIISALDRQITLRVKQCS